MDAKAMIDAINAQTNWRQKSNQDLSDFLIQIDTALGACRDEKGQSSAALSALREYYGPEPVTFFGDRMYQGGNDYPLAEALKAEDNGNVVVAVQNPEDTLQRLLDMAMAQAS